MAQEGWIKSPSGGIGGVFRPIPMSGRTQNFRDDITLDLLPSTLVPCGV